MGTVSKITGRHWPVKLIESTKRDIKAELDDEERRHGIPARLALALRRLQETVKNLDPDSQLQAYIYLVSSLVHTARHGGLEYSRILHLYRIAYDILSVQGVSTSSEKLGHLYGDLHQVLSQIFRSEGDHWRAAWELQVAQRLIRTDKERMGAFQRYSEGLRLLRLGEGPQALSAFETAFANSPQGKTQALTLLACIKTMRLMGRRDDAESAAVKAKSLESLSEDELNELRWEELCIACNRSQDPSQLIATVAKDKSHFSRTYILECKLWLMGVKSKRWLTGMAKISTLVRRRDLKIAELTVLYTAVRHLEECYDAKIPLDFRINNLGKVLANRNQLVSIDQELLVLAVATRWVIRIHAFGLAQLTLLEYRALSRRLSGSDSDDALGILGDVHADNGSSGASELVEEA